MEKLFTQSQPLKILDAIRSTFLSFIFVNIVMLQEKLNVFLLAGLIKAPHIPASDVCHVGVKQADLPFTTKPDWDLHLEN